MKGVIMMDHIKLHPYQEYAKEFIKNNNSCGLFLDMGLGKTLITLSALYDINPHGHVLIIAPKNIARSTWLDEVEKWKIPLRIRSFITNNKGRDNSKKVRYKLYEDAKTAPPTIYLINRELLTDFVDYFQPHFPFPVVVIDEFQSFKSHSSQRFRALKKVRPQIQRLIGLTGTPTPNGLMDLWAQIFLIDEGERLGPNITAYRDTYFTPGLIVNGYPVSWNPRPGAEDAIYKNIEDVVISMKNTLPLPDITYNKIFCHMNDKEMKTYKTMAKEQVLTFGQDEIIAANAAVLTSKLSQLASGAIYTNEDHDYKVIHRRKLENLAYLIRNTADPVIVAYHFKTDITLIQTYLTALGMEVAKFDGSQQMVKDWNDKKIPIMLIQPQSAGHGLNLQKGGHTLIWYTVPWSLESYLQTNARIYRQGQDKPVVIHHLLTKDTIDEYILKKLEKKDTSQQELLNAVERTIGDLTN